MTLEESRKMLEQKRADLFDSAKKFMEERNESPIESTYELFIITIFKRARALLSGFILLHETNNYQCAAPLIRLQLDSLLRSVALFKAQDADQFLETFFVGGKIRNLKLHNGKKMTDAELIKELEVLYPAGKSFYGMLSSYVHLSNSHLFSAIKFFSDKENSK
ncbi:hypothetical protein [Leptospira barantonii]|uniref:DUF1564 family protein n=1 Tax=Leptospira barantonii TaxID=2023184 RepID=A0ABX4NRR7_9LEPT|nr:hypothetical protein [Leptospira barantonii]PJZ58287.1 hypothetical protein CH367_07875 [Leptospira barantonii]